MPVVANADIGAAIMLRLKSCTELTTGYTASRIFLEWPKNPPLVVPTTDGKYLSCILIETGKGGRGNIGSGLREERVDVKYYGANRKTANDMYRLGTSFLVPPTERVKSSFVLAGCSVAYILEEGVGAPLNDPGAANWPYTLGTYIVTYRSIPVS